MFRFIHAADIHLDSPLRGLERYEGAPVEEIRSATRRALENLVRLATDEQVDFVLIAGDLYDGDWPDHNTGLFFAAQMAKLRAANIPLFLITGNHDAAKKMTRSLPLPENVTMLSYERPETVLLEEIGVAIHGQGFGEAKVDRNVVPDYPAAVPGYFNIGMLHTSLDGAEGHSSYAPCTLNDLRSRSYDYWALGHVHNRAIVEDDPKVVYPGNIQGRHIRETGAKGCMLVSVDDAREIDVQFAPLDVFRWEECRVDVYGAADVDAVLEMVATELAKLVRTRGDCPLAVRVVVEGASRTHAELIAERERWTADVRAKALDVAGGRIWIEKIELRTTMAVDTSDAMDDDGPIGELLRYCRELAGDEPGLKKLTDVLAPLRRSLPGELTSGPDALRLDDPGWVLEALAEVEPLLLSRLLCEEASR